MKQFELNALRAEDREHLDEMLTAINGAKNALHRDDCGDPAIIGSRGHITACDGVFSIYVVCQSPKHWTWAKKALDFCDVFLDGDDEGIMTLTRLPTADEAEAIRHYTGVKQTRPGPTDHPSWFAADPDKRGRIRPD
jgi:hypothetical protein